MEMDLDALLLQEDSEDEHAKSVTTDEEAKSDVAWRPESPCSVEAAPPALPPVGHRRTKRRDQEHRERHRESMARYRQEQRARVEALTAQQTALHRILLRVLAHNKQVDVNAPDRTPLARFQAQFTELVRTKETLAMEQRQLLESVAGHVQRFGSLQILMDHRLANAGADDPHEHAIEERLRRLLIEGPHRDLDALPGPGEPPPQAIDGVEEIAPTTGHWLEFLPHEPRLFYENESHESSNAIVRAGLEAIQAVQDALSDPTRANRVVASCLGWRAEQTTELDASTGRRKLQMRFTKRIPRARTTLQELQDKTWVFLNSPELIARVNNGAVTAKVAQQLHDDTIVLLRNSPDKHGHRRFRYFSLNARMWSTQDGSARVLMLVLDKEARLERPLDEDETRPPLRWMKHGGSSLHFSYAPDDPGALEIEYTGYIESPSDEHAAFLMVANSAALLRWEHLVVPPRLLV